MFSNFSLDKLTTSINAAAQQVEESLKNNTYLPTDVSNTLSFKKTSRFFQEKVGTISEQEISKLPESYTSLERKTDQLVKILKRIIIVTKTYEIDGYDYPPNLTESLNDWWSQQPMDKQTDLQFSKSFASAISKSAYESEELLKVLNKKNTKTTLKQDETEEPADEAEEEEEDEEITNLIEIFNSWCKCFQNIDKNKINMDAVMIKEFNVKLEKMIQEDYKNVMTLRNKVNDSRLEFDTVRHEVKIKDEATEKAKAQATTETPVKTEETKTDDKNDEHTETKTEKTETKTAEKSTEDTTATTDDPTETEDYKLLEKLEDEFVSNTTEAAEGMMEFTNNVEIIKLIKLFQKTQLDYYKKCTEELEKSIKYLDEFDTEEPSSTA